MSSKKRKRGDSKEKKIETLDDQESFNSPASSSSASSSASASASVSASAFKPSASDELLKVESTVGAFSSGGAICVPNAIHASSNGLTWLTDAFGYRWSIDDRVVSETKRYFFSVEYESKAIPGPITKWKITRLEGAMWCVNVCFDNPGVSEVSILLYNTVELSTAGTKAVEEFYESRAQKASLDGYITLPPAPYSFRGNMWMWPGSFANVFKLPHPSNLSQGLWRLRASSNAALAESSSSSSAGPDYALDLDDGQPPIKIHKTVLMARSPVYRMSLTGDSKDSKLPVSQLLLSTDVLVKPSRLVVAWLVRYLYLDELPLIGGGNNSSPYELKWPELAELYGHANLLQLEDLKKKLAPILAKAVESTSLESVLSFLRLYPTLEIQQAAVECVRKNPQSALAFLQTAFNPPPVAGIVPSSH